MHANDKLTLEQWSKLTVSDSHFDEDYFEAHADGGFAAPYTWDNMRVHIEKKLDLIERIYGTLNINSMLFCGCAKGFEVKEARKRGYDARGLDISQYAIDNADPKAKDYLTLGDVSKMPFEDNDYDLVGAFDVLHILDDFGESRRERAYKEVQRVSRKGLVIRTTAKWRGGKDGYYQDGNPLTLWSPEKIIYEVEKHGKMEFFFTMLSNRFEISWFFFCRKGEQLAWREYYV